MRTLVSIIIPTKNSEEVIGTCLKSVGEQTYPDIEVVVVDSYSSDGTREIAEKFGAKIIVSKTMRSKARNIGAEKARGEFILFLDSDMELTPRVVEECIKKVEEGYDAVIIPEVSVGVGFWTRCKALEKVCYLGDDLIEAARFFKKEVFESVGGYDSQLEAGEDWDLNQRIRKAGYRIGRINAFIRHYEGKLSLRETMSKKYHYGKTLKRYQVKHPKEAKQQLRLIRAAFMKNWKELAKDPIHALGMLFMKACEFGVGGLSYLVNRNERRLNIAQIFDFTGRKTISR